MISCSVVIPLYNKASYISRAISSVLVQTIQDFEIIVVDDGSTDNGAEVVTRFSDKRIRLIQQRNKGVSGARNVGIKKSSGQLIAFLDADDEWDPHFLENIFKLRVQHPNAGLYATAYKITDTQGKEVIPTFKEIATPPWEGIIKSYFRSAAMGAPPVTASSCCIPKHILNEVGGFTEGKRMGEDLDLWGRIAIRYPVAFTWTVGAVYHHDAENRACTVFGQGDEHPFSTTVKILHLEGKIPASLSDDIDLYVARLKVENMRQHVIAGNIRRARELHSEVHKSHFWFRRLLWGSRFNALTKIIWDYKYKRRSQFNDSSS